MWAALRAAGEGAIGTAVISKMEAKLEAAAADDSAKGGGLAIGTAVAFSESPHSAPSNSMMSAMQAAARVGPMLKSRAAARIYRNSDDADSDRASLLQNVELNDARANPLKQPDDEDELR